MPKRVIVTGGAGFIGSHLVEALLASGHSVIVLDNLATGRLENIKHLKSNPSFSFRQSDISKLEDITSSFDGIDWVFHLAGLADIVPSITCPFAYHRANVDGTACVLEASRQARVGRFIYAASSSCYGIPTQYPTPEDGEIRPMYPYALTKLLGESYVLHWAKVYKLGCVSLRLFNVYGPRSRTSGTYGAVFGVSLAQKRAGVPFIIVGDGNQTRDFTFVSDVASAFIKAAEADVSGEIFNVGSGGTYSINRLADLLGGSRVHLPKRPGERDCTLADHRKIRRKLGWCPQVSFEEGVGLMLRNMDQWSHAPVWDERSIATATRDWFENLSD
jgi:UDP-glucose 4-epimerase